MIFSAGESRSPVSARMKRSFAAWLILGGILVQAELFASLPGRYSRFERLFPESGGTPVMGISSILQDREGYLWFGTMSGLARYDGYRFVFHSPPSGPGAAGVSGATVVYPAIEDSRGDIWFGTDGQGLFGFDKDKENFVQFRLRPDDPASLGGDTVLAIQEGQNGCLWVGTRLQGLDRFDRRTETFSRVPLDPAAGAIWDLLVDGRGFLWVGTQAGGLFRRDPASGEFKNFRFAPQNPRSLGSDTVWSIFQDREGTIWVGTKGGGLNRFVPESESFIRFDGDAAQPRDLVSPPITAIAEDEAGRLWIGTSRSGLRIWDPKSGEYLTIKHDSQDADSLTDDGITSILKDASGVMWVGTSRGGIAKCLADGVKFAHYKHNRFDIRSVTRNDVRALWRGDSGNLWVGFDEGLDEIDEATGRVRRFRHDPSDPGSLGVGAVLCLCGDGEGRIWAGLDDHGLACLDSRTGRIERYSSDPGNLETLSNNRVYAILPDRSDPGVLWIGTHRGLCRLDSKTRRFTRFFNDDSDPDSLSGNIITALCDGGSGVLWVGTRWGLNRLDKATGKCERYISRLEAPPGMGINDNIVNCLHQTRAGILWVGTDNGLNLFDRSRGEWRAFARKEGLGGGVVCGILEDAAGALWVSTNRGLSKFDPESGKFTNFGVHDGLQGDVFNSGASFGSADGRLFFGGTNGFNAFDPAAVRKNPFLPPVVWTAFFRNNTEVKLPQSLSTLRRLTLPYKAPLATFEFAALSFAAPEMNSFAYRLEPRDRDWIPLVPEHRVSLSGIGAGRYRLRVKAASPDGIWNEDGIVIEIEVPTPPWRTWWFALLVAAFLAAGVVSAARLWKRAGTSSLAMGADLDAAIDGLELTSREQEILRLVIQGARNKDIERKLFISASTVRNHISNIYGKPGVRNRLELIRRISREAGKKS